MKKKEAGFSSAFQRIHNDGDFIIGENFLLMALLFTILMTAYAVQKNTQRQVANRECFIHCLVLMDKCAVTSALCGNSHFQPAWIL